MRNSLTYYGLLLILFSFFTGLIYYTFVDKRECKNDTERSSNFFHPCDSNILGVGSSIYDGQDKTEDRTMRMIIPRFYFDRNK